MAKSKSKAEYGDFQTPGGLARKVCSLLKARAVQPASLLEPNCGLGNLFLAGLDCFSVQKALGVEINQTYVSWVDGLLAERKHKGSVNVLRQDFFDTDWRATIASLPEPILVLGNPPWVTNSELASLSSANLPAKSNFQKRAGLDAITGKANFDISEWMLIQLVEAMNGRRGTLAMLCKSTVARKILAQCWKNGLQVERSAIYAIEADVHFDASVDAVLMVIDFGPRAEKLEAPVYPSLNASEPGSIMAFGNGGLVADADRFERWQHLATDKCLWKWRSGIKHDCSKVMELQRREGKLWNGLGKAIDIEEECLYPMMKSSEVANDRGSELRWMIVTQTSVGESTDAIRMRAPKTWAYLTAHAELLANRRSSIYKNRPTFSVFGVGPYSFSPWKVAISGFYKRLSFSLIGPVNERPVVLDDTSYFLPFETQEAAELVASMLNSETARSFYEAYVFWDSKRPITVDLLCRLDLRRLAAEVGIAEKFSELFPNATAQNAPPRRGRRKPSDTNLMLWGE